MDMLAPSKETRVDKFDDAVAAFIRRGPECREVCTRFVAPLRMIVTQYLSKSRFWCYECFKSCKPGTASSTQLYFCRRCRVAKYCSEECFQKSKALHNEGCFDASSVSLQREIESKTAFENAQIVRKSNFQNLAGMRLVYVRKVLFDKELREKEGDDDDIDYTLHLRLSGIRRIERALAWIRVIWAAPMIPELILGEDFVCDWHPLEQARDSNRFGVDMGSEDAMIDLSVEIDDTTTPVYAWMFFWGNLLRLTISSDLMCAATASSYSDGRSPFWTALGDKRTLAAVVGNPLFNARLQNIAVAKFMKTYCKRVVMHRSGDAALPMHNLMHSYVRSLMATVRALKAKGKAKKKRKAPKGKRELSSVVFLLNAGVLDTLLQEIVFNRFCAPKIIELITVKPLAFYQKHGVNLSVVELGKLCFRVRAFAEQLDASSGNEDEANAAAVLNQLHAWLCAFNWQTLVGYMRGLSECYVAPNCMVEFLEYGFNHERYRYAQWFTAFHKQHDIDDVATAKKALAEEFPQKKDRKVKWKVASKSETETWVPYLDQTYLEFVMALFET